MTNKTKIAVAAALIAAFATPALAQGTNRHHTRYEQSYQTQDQRFIEGRNAATYGDFGAPSSGRDAMVQSLGN